MEAGLVPRYPATSTGARFERENDALKLRACSTCARLKMKCRWDTAGIPSQGRPKACARCARLNISCEVPKDTPRKKRGKSTRVAQLEQKIDGIMSLLSNNQSQTIPGSSPLTPESQGLSSAAPAQSHQADSSSHTPIASIETPSSSVRRTRSAAAAASNATAPNDTVELVPGFSLTMREAATYLDIYRIDYMSQFPFVLIPESETAPLMYQEKPHLFWVVMAAVMPQSEAVHIAIKDWFRQYLAEHLIVKQEKSLDLLQAILVHLAWGLFHFYIDVDTTNFTHLAHALIIDLKLDTSPEVNHISRQSLLGAAWSHMNKSHLFKRRVAHSTADKRAIMGFYHISSTATLLFRRGPSLRWTSYMTQICDSLSTPDCDALDGITAAMARLQNIANGGFSALPGLDHLYGTPATEAYGRSHDMTLAITRREMDAFVRSQGPNVQRSDIFQLLYRVLLIRLYEPLLNLEPAPNGSNSLHLGPIRRTENLWKLTEACADFFRYHLSMDSSSLPCYPFTVTGFIAFAIVTSSRVLLLEADDWDASIAQQHFDYAGAAVRLGSQFEEADVWAKQTQRRRHMMNNEVSIMETYGQKMRWIAHWYKTRIQGGSDTAIADPGAPFPTAMSSAENRLAGEADIPVLPPNFAPDALLDDGFWQELFMYPPVSYGAPGDGQNVEYGAGGMS